MIKDSVKQPIRIEPKAIQKSVIRPKAMSTTFADTMTATTMLAPAAAEALRMGTGSNTAAAVLYSAFSAFPGAVGSPYAQAYWGGPYGYGAYSEYPGIFGPGKYGYPGGIGTTGYAAEIPGMEGSGITQADLINTMNQNNLKLLELQAIMQSNMQAWNTKSNILSADHRARMAMIEKFTARG